MPSASQRQTPAQFFVQHPRLYAVSVAASAAASVGAGLRARNVPPPRRFALRVVATNTAFQSLGLVIGTETERVRQRHGEVGASGTTHQLLECAENTVQLLVQRRLHVVRDAAGRSLRLPDGRHFVVFRETTAETDATGAPVVLAIWFRLKFVPPRARVRGWIFERESILNTLMFAGFPGYARKLWMVNRDTAEYAGLYEWRGEAAARRYAGYVVRILKPLSVPRSVGYAVLEEAGLGRAQDASASG